MQGTVIPYVLLYQFHGILMTSKSIKEVIPMKTAVCKPNYPAMPKLPYPNAATRRQLLQRFLDTALVIASGIGLAAAFLLLAVLV